MIIKNAIISSQRASARAKTVLPGINHRGRKNKSGILLRGIEILSEYQSLGLKKYSLEQEMNSLMAEARKQYPENEALAVQKLGRELHEIDAVIAKYRGEKEALIQILLDINARKHWLSPTSLKWVSLRLDVPLSQVYHIASFYKAFSLIPQGRHLIQVCLGTACQVRGAVRLLDMVVNELKIQTGETDKENRFSLATVNCLGCCALGPVMMIDGDYYSNPSPDQITKLLAKYE